jgi:hypothetical protein
MQLSNADFREGSLERVIPIMDVVQGDVQTEPIFHKLNLNQGS